MKAHEHFCSCCHSYGKTKGVTRGASGRGWWKCTDKHCVKLTAAMCKVHIAIAEHAGHPSEE